MEYSANILRSIKELLLEILFPQVCLGCKSPGDILCVRCVAQIRTAERETSSGIYACFDYRDPLIKKVIWDLKYHNRHQLGQKLGCLLYEERIEDIADMRMYTQGRPILVLPVPLSRTRKKTRGYNQAEYIARSFCRNGGKEIFELKNNIIQKKIDTKAQARITNRTTRLQNIRGAFSIEHSEEVRGRTIIIVDDVTTTGGTLVEIMNLLKKSGAKKVVGFAIAH